MIIYLPIAYLSVFQIKNFYFYLCPPSSLSKGPGPCGWGSRVGVGAAPAMGQKEGLPGRPYTHRATCHPCLLLEGQRPEQCKQQTTSKSSGVSPKFQSPTQSPPTRLMAQRGSLLDSPNRMAPLFPSSGQMDSRAWVTSTHPADSGRAPKQYLHPPPSPQVAMPCT